MGNTKMVPDPSGASNAGPDNPRLSQRYEFLTSKEERLRSGGFILPILVVKEFDSQSNRLRSNRKPTILTEAGN